MSSEDRERWNGRYRALGDRQTAPSGLLVELDDHLPRTGRALDLAGGAGRHAIWLARRGLEVTLTDISEVALATARERAAAAEVDIRVEHRDLDVEPIPTGPWHLVVIYYFVHRPCFAELARHMAAGGLLVAVHPTATNASRHPNPSSRFLVADGELPTLFPGLEVVRYEEGWIDEDRHVGRLLAEKPGPGAGFPGL